METESVSVGNMTWKLLRKKIIIQGSCGVLESLQKSKILNLKFKALRLNTS